MKKCPSCGTEIPDDASFCSSCGASVSNIILSDKKSRFCPHCGKAIEGDVSFCPHCGKSLKEGKEEQTTKSSFSFEPSSLKKVPPRSVALWVVLSILTCGICCYIWYGMLVNDINESIEDDWDTSGWLAVILSIITCNIYTIFACYKMGKKLETSGNDFSVLVAIISLFIPLISIAIIQDKVNTILGK